MERINLGNQLEFRAENSSDVNFLDLLKSPLGQDMMFVLARWMEMGRDGDRMFLRVNPEAGDGVEALFALIKSITVRKS